MIMRYCLLFLLLCYTAISDAQNVVITDEQFLRDVAHFQVKDVAQFMDRFNDQEQVVFKNDTAPDRYKNLLGLLNLRDTALRRDTNTIAFINEVFGQKDKKQLTVTDSDLYAAVQCVFVYHGKEKVFTVWLKPEAAENGGHYWGLIGVQSDLFSLPNDPKSARHLINPMNHEVGFSELSKGLTHKKDIYEYMPADYHPEHLSAFLAYVHNGDLQFKNIRSVDFDFLQINGWLFTVKEFFRVDLNSGWLIADIKRMNEEQKKHFLKDHFIE